VIGPWAAQFGAFLGEHAAYLVDPLEVAVAEAVQPVADLGFEPEVLEARILPLTLGQVTSHPAGRGPIAA